MSNGQLVKDNIVNLIAKIGEKNNHRRADFFDKSNGTNFSYVHSAIEKVGKIISVVKLEELLKVKMRRLEAKWPCISRHQIH